MSAHFAQAKACQVFESDLYHILLFPEISLSTLQSALVSCNTQTKRNESLSAKLAAIYTLTQTALTQSQLREQVTNGLVKVAVPRFRREALIDRNTFVQRMLALHAEKEEQQATKEKEKQNLQHRNEKEAQRIKGNDGKKDNNLNSKTNETSRSNATVHYRVGRVVAILPKPGTEQNEINSMSTGTVTNTSDSEDNNNNISASLPALLASVYNNNNNNNNDKKAALYSKWLIAVHFGEAIEVLNLKTIVNDPFTEEEFMVYSQSSLATTLNASCQGKLSSAGPNVLLTSEQAEALRTKLQTLRTALQVLSEVCQNEKQTTIVENLNNNNNGNHAGKDSINSLREENIDKVTSAILEHSVAHVHESEFLSVSPASSSSQHKRSRTDLEKEEQEYEQINETEKKRSSGSANSNAQLQIAVLQTREREMMEQLHKLRELIVIRDNELTHALQTQRQMENSHQSELAQWRTKLDEEAQGRLRMQRELSSAMKDKSALLDEANVKLRRLAEMTMKYKRVVDEVKRQLSEAVNESNSYSVKQVSLDTPEAILAQLKQATIRMKQ